MRKRIDIARKAGASPFRSSALAGTLSRGEAGGGTYPDDHGRDQIGGCQGVNGPEPSTLLDEHETGEAAAIVRRFPDRTNG